MKDWEYAQLTHDAAQAGGVRQYIATIHEAGFVEGKSSMYPWIPVAVGAGWLIKLMVDKAIETYTSWKESVESLKRDEEIAKESLEKMCKANSSCKEQEADHD